MQYNLDQVIDRRDSDSAKWAYFDPDVLPLWVADMDFVSAEPIVRALRERVDHGIFGYAMPPQALREVIVARMHSLYEWRITEEDIVFIPGVVPGFNMACRAVSQPGDGILVQPPVYYPFLSAPANSGLELQCAEVTWQGSRYGIDWQAFEDAISSRTSAFLFCNPHNPVGRVYERGELAHLAEICLRHGLVIVSDEIHCDLVFRGHRHLPIASLAPEIGQRSITLMAPSKTFNIAGLQCSFAIIQNPELRAQFTCGCAGLLHGANLLAYTAAMAAYTEGQEWLSQVLAYLQENRDFVQQYISDYLPGIEVVVPEGTYLAWIDCRQAGIPGQPGDFFMNQARVALNEGAKFGPGGEGFVRLNFGCPRSTLVKALERMRTALERVRQ